ncbi:MAG: hypothetical protein JWP61_2093 [Friedmanniella sp.]|jgi:hypothetical protein|nr:hypothetical protein [Friedmanniella sp.]
MVRRLFWFVLGAGLAVYVVSKVRSSLAKASPEALVNRASGSVSGLGERAQDFAARVRAAAAERETELRDTLGLPE